MIWPLQAENNEVKEIEKVKISSLQQVGEKLNIKLGIKSIDNYVSKIRGRRLQEKQEFVKEN